VDTSDVLGTATCKSHKLLYVVQFRASYSRPVTLHDISHCWKQWSVRWRYGISARRVEQFTYSNESTNLTDLSSARNSPFAMRAVKGTNVIRIINFYSA